MKLVKTGSFTIAINEYGDSQAAKVCILLPGRLDTKDYVNFVSHGNYLAKLGYYVLAIDPPGTWDSPGDLAGYTTTMYVKTVNELIAYLGNRPTLLLGHSRGGAVAMIASGNPSVEAIVVVNAAYEAPSPADLTKIINGALPEFRDLPPGAARTAKKRQINLPLAYFEDGAKYIPADSLRKFKKPKLVIHATKDEFKPIKEVQAIYDELPEPKMFLPINCTHDYRLFPNIVSEVNTAIDRFLKLMVK